MSERINIINEYAQKAKDFLVSCNATMKIELVGCDIPTHWKGETARHNHYQFTITTPKGTMTDDFWDSIRNTELSQMTFDEYCRKNRRIRAIDMSYSEKNAAQKIWKAQIKKAIPTEYDILTCLEVYIPDTFEEFCSEFGYDEDSISALNIYLACQKQWAKIRKIFTCLPEADDGRQKRRFFRHVSELIAYDDCTDICVQKIVYRGKPVHYCGWQPGMLFDYKDEDGNLVYSNYFPEWDH